MKNMKEFVEKMKKYVEKMKKYEELHRYNILLDLALPYIGSGTWKNFKLIPQFYDLEKFSASSPI